MLLPVCSPAAAGLFPVCSSVNLQEEIEYLDEEDLGFDPNAEDMEDWSSGEEYSGSGKRAYCCWGVAAGQALLERAVGAGIAGPAQLQVFEEASAAVI